MTVFSKVRLWLIKRKDYHFYDRQVAVVLRFSLPRAANEQFINGKQMVKRKKRLLAVYLYKSCQFCNIFLRGDIFRKPSFTLFV